MKELREYIGCIHVHSVYSDGSGTYPEIIHDAQSAGLDYLMMSDHMNLKGREEGFAGWHGNLFVSVGYEMNDADDRHHYLIFGLDNALSSELTHEQYIKVVKEKKALGIAAHPFEERISRSALPGYPAITWSSLDYPEIETIELWNMMSHWLELTTMKNVLWNVVHPRSFSTFPSKKLIDWWDNANLVRKVTAIGSIDVHATKFKILCLFPKAIFDYKVMFKSIRTHLLTNEEWKQSDPLEKTEAEIRKIISSGNCFFSNYRRGDAKGFRMWAENGSELIGMGETGHWKSATVRAILPKKAVCRLIRNGQPVFEQKTDNLEIKVDEGVYRLEAEKDHRGWIYSNHIRIKENG
ncbi:MAG: histidinol-phosphatase [Candidatus Marinimicrobia bacterium CG08_land_8_20_14_0_20_45_22]|nr:MAG: histidinol-phosphatase [Candidatus Marinimicrobia bacterium CG08_land_8_20_14_0_20_45_22]